MTKSVVDTKSNLSDAVMALADIPNDVNNVANMEDAMRLYAEIGDLMDMVSKITTALKKTQDNLRVLDRMLESGENTVNVDDMQFVIKEDYKVSTADKNKLHDWLRRNNMEEMIVQTVSGSALRKTMLDRMEQGKDIPDDAVNVTKTKSLLVKSGT